MEDSQNSHDPYAMLEEEKAPPVIQRVKNEKEEDVFYQALARMHRCTISDIKREVTPDGHWLIYKINGKQIFKDKAK